jgi:hypothetical protein
VSRPDAGSVLGRALVAWGLGHLALGHVGAGRALLAAEVVTAALVAWLVVGLADTSAYLVPYLAGVLFLVAWGWQAVDAYRIARRGRQEQPADVVPARSEAVAIGWLALPLLVWGAGFWLVAAEEASPSATLDRFVTAWTAGSLDADEWGAAVVTEADAAADALGTGEDRFSDVRVRIVDEEGNAATAVAEAVHFVRQPTTFLWVFPGTELVPVADDEVLRLELAANDASLPGGGSIGAVRWSIVGAEAGP